MFIPVLLKKSFLTYLFPRVFFSGQSEHLLYERFSRFFLAYGSLAFTKSSFLWSAQ